MKYTYLKVIKQRYTDTWEDVSEYEVNSGYQFKTKEERQLFKHDLREYKFTGYSTWVVNRKIKNETI